MCIRDSPNTIQRAYNQLETEGYLYSVPGKGSFACRPQSADQARRETLLEELKGLLSELRCLGMTQTELLGLWKGAQA